MRVIQKLADDERTDFPKAADVIRNHLYVDDLLTGAESINEARNLRDQIIALLAKGGFSIRQWASNDTQIIDDLDTSIQHTVFTFKSESSVKTLGITWNIHDDKIYYTTQPIKITKRLTKRNLLSELQKSLIH